MKVLMFGWEFPPHISGGLGTACFGLTKDLAKLDADVTFVLPKIKGNYDNTTIKVIGSDHAISAIQRKRAEQELEQKKEKTLYSYEHFMKVYELDSSLHPYMNKETYKKYYQQYKEKIEKQELERPGKFFESDSVLDMTGDYGADLMTEVQRYGAMGKLLSKTESFDVIHAHDWMTYQAGVEAKIQSGKPLVVHVHATEFDRTGENVNGEIYCIERYGMDQADKIVTVSERTKKIIVDKYNQKPDKVKVVYNAVEKDDMAQIDNILDQSSFENDKIVVFLGRITGQKGPGYFLDAAAQVYEKVKNVRFVMAGSGDMATMMIEKMAHLKIMDRFHFTGFLNSTMRDKLFAMSDLYVMPSVSEPFGITPLEAMKHNIPVIVSKQSGISEILKHVVTVDCWDVNKLASSIIEILQKPEASKAMLEENRKCLASIDWHTAAKEVLDVYHECVQ